MADEEKPIEGRFPGRWLKDEPDRESVKAELMAARPALERLDQIIQDKRIKANLSIQPDFFDSGWPYRCADLNGYFRALDEIQKLIPRY